MAYHFNNRIEITDTVSGMNDESGFSEVEKTIAKPWADIKTMRNTEFESMGFDVTEEPIRFIIRYRKGINVKQKVKYNGNLYNIKSVTNDDGKNYTLTIFATKKTL